jgi:hypothetical protein
MTMVTALRPVLIDGRAVLVAVRAPWYSPRSA